MIRAAKARRATVYAIGATGGPLGKGSAKGGRACASVVLVAGVLDVGAPIDATGAAIGAGSVAAGPVVLHAPMQVQA